MSVSKYGACDRTAVDFNQDEGTEISSTTVTRVNTVSKQYMISEQDYNRMNSRSKLYCTFGGITSAIAVGAFVYHVVYEMPDERTMSTILVAFAQGMFLLGNGMGTSMPLLHTREVTLQKQT